jgi:hypothetical protein
MEITAPHVLNLGLGGPQSQSGRRPEENISGSAGNLTPTVPQAQSLYSERCHHSSCLTWPWAVACKQYSHVTHDINVLWQPTQLTLYARVSLKECF